jgi:hypothetical protein
LRAPIGPSGAALHPQVMLGLVVYGIINRQWSLRGLEGLVRRDVGAWWVCGGHQPDHSTIGKFIQLHAETLAEEFFVELVRSLMNKLVDYSSQEGSEPDDENDGLCKHPPCPRSCRRPIATVCTQNTTFVPEPK